MKEFLLLVCGSRNWCAPEKVYEELSKIFAAEGTKMKIIHGGCPTGADFEAGKWAKLMDIPCDVYIPDWKEHGKAAGPIRNQKMIDQKPDMVLAFHYKNSRGTEDTIKRAKKAGIPVLVVT